MNIVYLLLSVPACWRVTHLLSEEDGPFDIFFMFRKKMGNVFLGKLVSCFYCCSVWVAIPFGMWIGSIWEEKILCWLAFSGMACLMERVTAKTIHNNYAIPDYTED